MFKKTKAYLTRIADSLDAITDGFMAHEAATAELTIAVRDLHDRLNQITDSLAYLAADRRHHNARASITVQ